MTYRNDRDALEERKSELESELSQLRAKLAANNNLESELLGTIRELEQVYAKLNATHANGALKRSLPLLAQVRVASPCNVPWDSMQGDSRVRHCASCEKNVYDLSAMTTAQAESLIREKNGNLCVTYFRRTDGTILTADCPVGEEKKKRSRRKAAVIATAIGAMAAGAIGAAVSMRRTSGEPSCDRTVETRVAGGIQPIPTPPPSPDKPPTAVTPHPTLEQGQMIMGEMAAPEHPTDTVTHRTPTRRAPRR
ncbi:MAG: hypothetical protein Q8Q09_28845 [Deltaproteobacteria bacterium]|nr:hypothetical protein [Deltaproteobacteria bacterium]